MVNASTYPKALPATKETILAILEQVPDPEVPVLSIIDLGIVRDVSLSDDGVEVFVTPTYSGCPATDAINLDIRLKLIEQGFNKVKITQRLSPAWTTDWMSESGRQKLKEYGIAPPPKLSGANEVECPQCHSSNTKLLSQFGSTACKALYQCNDCKEPFDHFKCH